MTRTLFTYGHNSAAGANGVAVYAFFPPFVPETNVGQFDPNVFTLGHIGFRNLEAVHINTANANPTQVPPGVVFDIRPSVTTLRVNRS